MNRSFLCVKVQILITVGCQRYLQQKCPHVLVDSHELMTLHITSSLEQHMSKYCPHSSDRYTQASHSLWKYLSSAVLQHFAEKLFLDLL